MAEIKSISKLKIGTTLYDIKDTIARQATTGGIHYKGTTAEELKDGSHKVPSDIYTDGATPAAGDLVIYGDLEFIATVNGSEVTWHEFGSTGSLKGLAFADTASGPTSADGSHHHNVGVSGTVVLSNLPVTGLTVDAHTYTPAGNVTLNAGTSLEAVKSVTPTTSTLATDTITTHKAVNGEIKLSTVVAGLTLGSNTLASKLDNGNVVDGVTPTTASFAHDRFIQTIDTTNTTLKQTNATIYQAASKSNMVVTTVHGVNGSTTTHDTPTLETSTAQNINGKIITDTTHTPMYANVTALEGSSDDGVLELSVVQVSNSQDFNHSIAKYGSSLTAGAEVTVPVAASTSTTVATGALAIGGQGAAVATDLTCGKAIKYFDATSGDRVVIAEVSRTSGSVVTGLDTEATSIVTGITLSTKAVVTGAKDGAKVVDSAEITRGQVVGGIGSGETSVVTGLTADTTKTFVTGLTTGTEVVTNVAVGTTVTIPVVESATFSGTEATLTHSVQGGTVSGNVDFKASGTTEAAGEHSHTVTVSPDTAAAS